MLIMYKIANLVLCNIILYWSPDDDPLWIETCKNTQCDIIIQKLRKNIARFVG
jgi:hypothetical protein